MCSQAMGEFWKSLSIEEQKLIGTGEKRRIYDSIAKMADANGTTNG